MEGGARLTAEVTRASIGAAIFAVVTNGAETPLLSPTPRRAIREALEASEAPGDPVAAQPQDRLQREADLGPVTHQARAARILNRQIQTGRRRLREF